MAKAKKAESAIEAEFPKIAPDYTDARDVMDDVKKARALGMRPDFAGKCLEGLDLSGKDLRACDFTGADLTNVNFSKANMQGCLLVGAIIDGADFMDACMEYSVR
jgi:uncharacterized protein YjbI with pentapeptide repeats